MRLQAKAEQLNAKKIFLGGPIADFERAGRLQLITLLRAGLYPDSKVVDIGCGCLRGGYWLIHFLDPDCYCGIEPDVAMLQAGITDLLEREVLEAKRPRFDTNSDFDTSVFGEKFDFFLARSIWTHASKPQIQQMLDSFGRDGAPGSVFLASYLPTDRRHPLDYQGEGWSSKLIHHRPGWMQQECQRRGLAVQELEEDRLNNQIWLQITGD
jgi:hypothetical protein